LELLGGNQLYGNSIWAYRELIQNAFDAVKEKIAYHIISDDKNPKEFVSKLGDLYSINLILDKRNDGFWLICKDQGVGMTKSIIEKFFLESGSSNRHQISELERKCKERSFNLGRTGQFGIGVLSYFMIAEKIVVKTKRELNTGYHDSESVSWRFEINGTHDFGELSRYQKPINGTEIELKLKEEIEKDILEWDQKFSSFLKQVVRKSPCTLTYSSRINNEQEHIRFGWTNTTQDLRSNIFDKIQNDILSKESIEDKIISTTEKEKLIRNNLLAKDVALEVRDTIDFLFDEGEIENIGKYRIFIPYFKLIKGNSFCFLKEEVTLTTIKF
jgi:HSP90 family molecular chaperone